MVLTQGQILVAFDNPKNPREYCGHFWVDCITHDQDMLRLCFKNSRF